jgi:hypothetical protein
MIFEVMASVVLSQPLEGIPRASSPESFAFIVTINGESFSSAVVPKGSGHLIPGQPTEICLQFLTPEAASKAIHLGSEFTFFEQYRVGTGRVLSINHA